jgi:two-component system, OmpR family, catabolic regulation response regulator CreB
MQLKCKVLVVEDEAAIADTITYALSTEGFEPVWTATGGEGLAVLGREDIALIILDIGLPDLDGFELCREIRKSSTVPIIFLTARSDEIDRVVGLEIGGDDYVVKPFSPRELTARVKAILRRRNAPDFRSNITEGNFPFIVDKDRLSVAYFGTRINLSRYELGIMMVLIRQPGRVFSRRRLMELVWEEPDSSWERTVDAHIKSLRRKLREIKPGEEPIKTHRGLGYSLREEW